jgi:hypothetical protein
VAHLLDSTRALVVGAAHDGCRQTRGQRPDTSLRLLDTLALRAWRTAFGRGVEYACEVHPTLSLRLVAAVGSSYPSIDSIIVLDRDSVRVLQVLARLHGESEAPLPHFTDVVRAMDLDADGSRDLLVGRFWGATGNTGYDVWRFRPSLRRFVADTALSQLSNPHPIPGRPCVATHSNSSVNDDGIGVYCLHEGRWRLDSAVTNTWNRDAGTITRETAVRRGDSLVRVGMETRPDSM